MNFSQSKSPMLLNSMPFLQTSAAAGGSRVLGQERRVTTHRGLLSIIRGFCHGESVAYELFRVLDNAFHPFSLQVGELTAAKRKTCSEL